MSHKFTPCPLSHRSGLIPKTCKQYRRRWGGIIGLYLSFAPRGKEGLCQRTSPAVTARCWLSEKFTLKKKYRNNTRIGPLTLLRHLRNYLHHLELVYHRQSTKNKNSPQLLIYLQQDLVPVRSLTPQAPRKKQKK